MSHTILIRDLPRYRYGQGRYSAADCEPCPRLHCSDHGTGGGKALVALMALMFALGVLAGVTTGGLVR